MAIKYICGFSLLFSVIVLRSQERDIQLLKDLSYYGDIMMNAEEIGHRQRAFESFNPVMHEILSKPDSYEIEFAELKWISRKYSGDKSFRILTWYIPVNMEENRYYGFLQTNDGKLFELKDGFKTTDQLESETEEFDSANWLGAMYYNIMDMSDSDGSKYYLLFGVNKWNTIENLKIADVLFFTKNGEPVFGKEVFQRNDINGKMEKLNRLILKYSADAMVSLNYNPGLEMIVMDHLIPRMSRIKGQETVMVPDGSYSGYVFKDGIWEYVDKLHTQILNEAPRPTPVLDERKNKTIMGTDKKPRKN